MLAHLVEETRAVSQHDRSAGDRIPDHVAKAAEAGKRKADLIPVRVKRHVFWRADGYQPLGGERDHARVSRVELEGLARRERSGKRHDCLVQLAGVVGVGIDGVYLEGNIFCADANVLPIERGGNLQWNAGERSFAVVADG